MRYTDLILKDFPIAVYPLDETISGNTTTNCYSITDTSPSQNMKGQYVYNAGPKVINTGMPLVLGGEDASFLVPNSGNASLTIPRLNCFSSNSIYTDSTLEFWLKIEKSTTDEIKILGIDDTGLNTFGLYVYKNYLLFKLDDECFISAPVQTWNTQHHIAIIYSYSGISLMVDGIKYYPIIKKSVNLNFQNNKNFLFYGSADLGSVAIDAVAIYKYGLTEQNAKRHMVYALGFSFAGSPFTRNNGVFAAFENANSKKIDDFIVPINDKSSRFESENVILSQNGIQLANNDKISYIKNNSNNTNFYFTNESYLKIESITNYLQSSSGLGMVFRATSTLPQDEEQTLFFIDGSENTGDIQVLLLNGNIYIRIYSIDKTGATPPYYEKNIGPYSINTNTLFAMSISGNEYKIYINDTQTVYTDLPNVALQEQSSIFIGALAQFSDTEQVSSFFSNGYITRVTLFKNIDEFISVINTTSGNLSRFNSYYKNITLTFDKRIKLYRKGSMGLNVGMDQFGKPIWNGTISRSSCGGIKLEHLYPKVTDPELTITISQYLPSSNTSLVTQIIDNEIEMIDLVDHEDDLTDRWMEIDVLFDSDDCLYFPPVLGQLLFTSMAGTVSTASNIDYDVSLEYLNIEGTIKLIAQDSLPYLEESSLSVISMGEYSGINISGLPMLYNYSFSTGSNDGADNSGIKTMSFFVKRNTSNTNKEIFSWTVATGTTSPTSVTYYIDGVSSGTVNLTSKTNILWSDISIDENTWRHLTFIFNTPIIYKTSTKEGPVIKFGNSSGQSNISIQYLGISENTFSIQQIEQIYKLFSGNYVISTGSSQGFSMYETAGGVQIYTNNWQRMT